MRPTMTLDFSGHSLDFVQIPSGKFSMGSIQGLPLELPTRTVEVMNPFWISTKLITQDIWMSVEVDNPSEYLNSSDLPVDGISFDAASSFCEKASSKVGTKLTLPTEAQWEFACRAETSSEFFWGDNKDEACEFGWFEENSKGRTHPVGTLRPNPWGLYDIVGNLWEWCQDTWHSDYEEAPTTEKAWTAQEETQPRRCLRGGAWDMDNFRLRSAYRSYEHSVLGTARFGLRIVIND